jgi:hypothetical protein
MLLIKGEATLMIGSLTLPHRSARLRVIAGALLFITGAACSGEAIGPSSEAALPVDSTATAPTDSTITPPADSTTPATTDPTVTPPTDSPGIDGALGPLLDKRSALSGIAFASDGMTMDLLNSVYTGTKLGGKVSPSNVLSLLAAARAGKGRVFFKLAMGSDSYVKSGGTFSFTKWKALVDRFRNVDLDEYIADGTLAGHFLIDEPHRAVKWGKVIPHATVEAMAQYSKEIWPDLYTFTHTQMSWLASTPVTYTYLDAGWVQYTANRGDVTKWVTSEIDFAKSKGLGLLVGMNVLAGGDPRLGLTGFYAGKYSMSANELRTYGTALLNQTYACGFTTWAHHPNYRARSDIAAAMAALSDQARSHRKTSCRQ